MGLFGNIKKNWKNGNILAGMQAAGAISHGDYGTAAQIQGMHRKQREETQQSEAERQQRAQLEAAAIRMGVPPQQAASLPTSALAGLVSQQYTPRAPSEFERAAQAGGISPGTPEWEQLNRQRANTMALPSPQPIVDPQTGSVRWVTPPAPGMPQGAPQAAPQGDGETKIVGGKTYRKVNGQWFEVGGGGGDATGGFPYGGPRFPF